MMEGLSAHQRQQLVDYKNKLMDESRKAYDFASIEESPATEARYLIESKIKMDIAKKIELIIYGE